MTPNEKLVWAAAFAQSFLEFHPIPHLQAAETIFRLRKQHLPIAESNAEADRMLEEMRRDA